MDVLFEDKHILVCEKPAGIPTQAGKITEKDMLSEVNNYLRRAGEKSPAYIIHRLDKPVRGILVFAKTKQAAAKLNSELTDNSSPQVVGEKLSATASISTDCKELSVTSGNKTSVHASNSKTNLSDIGDKGFIKHYTAMVEGLFDDDNKEGVLKNYIYKDGSKAFIDDERKNTSSKEAILEYKVISEETVKMGENVTHICKVSIILHTGRFHQIRCQLSNINHPIVGDTLYGSKLQYEKRQAIGLIADSLSFTHPITKKRLEFTLNL